MTSKLVGYSGFRSYAEHPYSTQKPGKELQRQNIIWRSTFREVDHINPLENFQTSKTIYKVSYLENTFPKHYHPQHVPKGGAQTLEFLGTNQMKACDQKKEAQNEKSGQNWNSGNGFDDDRKHKLLKTGTEHWGSIYKKDISKESLAGFLNTGSKFGRKTANSRKNNFNKSDNSKNFNQTVGSNFGRNSSADGNNKQNSSAEQCARAKSYKNRPYINHQKTGQTDYRFNYGQKIGSSPMDLMTRVSIKQPVRDNPLKRGTNQLWTQIPNYQGFKPSQLSFKELTNKIETRNQQNKGILKLQTADNFSSYPPGYGGFKPQFQRSMAKIRTNCLST